MIEKIKDLAFWAFMLVLATIPISLVVAGIMSTHDAPAQKQILSPAAYAEFIKIDGQAPWSATK